MSSIDKLHTWTRNRRLIAWIGEAVALCKPGSVHLCDGSLEEYDALCRQLVEKGIFVPLNPAKRPHSFWCHSSPEDVARVEEATFICSKSKEDAGPTNNWRDPVEMLALLKTKFSGSMRGRTLYVIPYCMGPIGSPLSHIGVQITDSPYVVCNMRIMTRMGKARLRVWGRDFSCPACTRSACPLSPARRIWTGPAAPTRSTSSTSPKSGASGRLAAATGATHFWEKELRSQDRLRHGQRRGVAG